MSDVRRCKIEEWHDDDQRCTHQKDILLVIMCIYISGKWQLNYALAYEI